MKYRITLLVAFFLISFPVVYTQVYDVARYADDSGLPSRIVRDVIQDHNGFLWVAGNNGLYKFDGQNFYPFYSNLKDSTGLRDNKITAVLESNDHKIWIGTPKGLHVLEDDAISYFTLSTNLKNDHNYIRSLVEDDEGNIWVGTYGGLFVIDKDNVNAFFVSDPEIGQIPEKPISGLSKNKNNSIWIVTNNNEVFVNTNESFFKFKEVNLTFDKDVADKGVTLFHIMDYNERFMLAESNGGLLKATFKSDYHLHLSHFKDADNTPIATENIYRAMVDHQGHIWTATWSNWFKKYRVDGEHLIEQEVIGSEGTFLSMSSNAMSVYEDKQNNIWIPNTNGLYRLTTTDNSINKFPPAYLPDCISEGLSVYAIAEDAGGHLWVTTPIDVYRFKKTDLYRDKCPTDYIHIRDKNLNLVRYLLIDSKNRLWLGAENGLSVTQLDKDFNPGKFIRFTTQHGLPHNWCQRIFEEDENNFWIGNYGGLVKLTINHSNIEDSTFKVYESDHTDKATLVNSYTMEITNDKKGNTWIGTFFGLSKLISEEGEGTFANYLSDPKDYESLSNDAIKRVFCDQLGRLWIGTQTGLNLYDDKTDTFIQFGRNEGLPSEYILGIEEDSKGFLWIATTNGVIRAKYDALNKTFNTITHYTKNSGLTDNITYRNAIHIDHEDTVFIGSRNGLSIIDKERNKSEPQPYNIAVTSIESIKKDTSGFNPIPFNHSEHIKLSHSENSIKINYAVLDLSRPKSNTYRHKILPLNDQWIETNNNSEITYYNLSPGEYEIILDGSNNNNSWSSNPLTINFIIAPPFWKSTLAKILYLLLAIGIIRMLYVFRIRRHMQKLEQQLQLERALVNEREQLRQENTADFHDELGSKVTKISLFLTLAERNLKEKKDPTEWFSKIRDNVKDLSGGFRDLLWVIDPKKDSLHDTVLRLKDYAEDLFNNGLKQFRIRGHLIDRTDIFLDPQTKKQVVMIFKEAMNNCAKYSECNNVALSIESKEHYSTIELVDDGIGFDVEKKSKGRGLKNMVARAKKVNAEITIKSNSEGTTIRMDRIPHMRDNYKEKEA